MAGRVLTESIKGTVGAVVKTTEHVYNAATGREVTTNSKNADNSTYKTISRTFDAVGRQTNYTDAEGHASSATYDLLGRVATTNDGKATRTNAYDPVTGDLISINDSGVGTFTGAYDADGSLITETLPGGIVKARQTDSTGSTSYISYNRTTGCSSNCLLYDNYAIENAHGQINGLWTSMTGQNPTTQFYDYDAAGRLTRTQDWRSIAGVGKCELRDYTYDADSNRVSKRIRPEIAASDCDWNGSGGLQINNYDSADRLTNTGYAYDAFGRTTTVPQADAGGSTNMTATYYVNDLAQSVTDSGTTQTLNLDPNLRMSTKVKTGGTSSTETYAYADDSDSPAWTQTGSAWNRTATGIGGDAEAAQDSASGVKLMIENMRGDVVALSTTAGVLSNISNVDEFGVPKSALPAGTKYAFHGSKRREALTAGGTVAMGVRLYVPQTGRFLQVDPVPGGTANPYEYPSDPVNAVDLDGRMWSWGRFKHKFGRAVNSIKRGMIDQLTKTGKHALWKFWKSAEKYVKGLGKAEMACVYANYGLNVVARGDTVYKGLLTLGLSNDKTSPAVQFYNNTKAQAKDFADAVNTCGVGPWYWVKDWLRSARKTASQ